MSQRTRPPAVVAATADSESGRTRAPAMPPSERRAEIVAATLPLLLSHGAAVTTREIAEASGVAEGTIFRVFADKESLIEAVVESVFDMGSIDRELLAIDSSLPLDQRLIEAVEILRRRFADIFRLRTAVEMMQFSKGGPPLVKRLGLPDLAGLARLFEPDRDQIRQEPLAAAYLLRGMTITGTHPALVVGEPLSSPEIVSLFLHGVSLAGPGGDAEGTGERC